MDWLILSTVMLLADWNQTQTIRETPGVKEGNIVLGYYPTKEEINVYFSSVIALNASAYYLGEKKANVIWKSVVVGQSIVVANNRIQLGIKFSY